MAQKGDQLGDRGNTKDLNALNELGLSQPAVAARSPWVKPACWAARVAGKIPRIGRRATIQPQLTQKDCSCVILRL